MTIACCYVSPEGVVFGADSTTSYGMPDGLHYFNHSQKVFEVGENSTYAVMFWGLAGFGEVSLRTLVAKLSDDLVATPATSVEDVATRWASMLHAAYQTQFATSPEVLRSRELAAQSPYNPANPNEPGTRTEPEEDELLNLQLALTIGTCVGGHNESDRVPAAYFLHQEPQVAGVPAIAQIPVNSYRFWGAPNMLERLLFAADQKTRSDILNSGHWVGTPDQLAAVFQANALVHPILPMREVVDFVHTCVHSTIKALKFSHFQQICGGPVELAVLSTDRKFRWVRHKEWGTAVVDGGLK